jgi:CubicO group peptidase (beta-lactamase class C family)
MKMNKTFIVLIALLTLFCSCKDSNISDNFERDILNGLRPAAYLPNNKVTYNIEDRMKHWNVPAVSFVVINNMKIAYSGAFGVIKKGDSSFINSNTLFQAASVSKPVAAVGVMTLAYKNELNIDVDINQLSVGWKLPYENYEEHVTIRQILSHSAGLSVGGFSGYYSEDNLPSLHQIIEGKFPANSPAVRIVHPPATKFMYSGGGYQVMQKIIEDATGKDFSKIMYENVFKPLNMKNSYYAPLDSIHKTNAAYGHTDIAYIPNHAPIHVESAAGGLWTTPNDLGLLLIELMKAYNNQDSKILDSLTLSSMMQPNFWNFGLGFKVLGEGKNFRFSHGGATNGWHSHFMAFPARGQAVVIMTNGTNGWILWSEIVRSVADVLNWPNERSRIIKPIVLKKDQITDYTGSYNMSGLEVKLKSESELLSFEGGGLKWDLIPSKIDTFEIVDMVGQVIFKRDKNKRIKGFHLWFEEPDWSPYRAWDFTKINDK